MGRTWFENLGKIDQISIFEEIASKTGLPVLAVEKDWWICRVIHSIFNLPFRDQLLFKGGTSLSKAWHLIDRFSEDIDLAINREFLGFMGDLSGSQISRLRRASGIFLTTNFLPALKDEFKRSHLKQLDLDLIEPSLPDTDPWLMEVRYPTLVNAPGYLLPVIRIEISCRSLWHPFSMSQIRPILEKHRSTEVRASASPWIPTATPERTFLEKLFLLHEEFHKPPHKIRVARLSRHLYDLYQLHTKGVGAKALEQQTLYNTIVSHRFRFARVAGVDYNNLGPRSVNPIPPAQVIKDWKKDYEFMLEYMIYERDPPTFEELINNLDSMLLNLKTNRWDLDLKFPIIKGKGD